MCPFVKNIERLSRPWCTLWVTSSIPTPTSLLENRTPVFVSVAIWVTKYLFSQSVLQLKVACDHVTHFRPVRPEQKSSGSFQKNPLFSWLEETGMAGTALSSYYPEQKWDCGVEIAFFRSWSKKQENHKDLDTEISEPLNQFWKLTTFRPLFL